MTIRVLLADDHAVMRDGLQALLQAAGCTVVGAVADGREAVRFLVSIKELLEDPARILLKI